MQFHRSSLWAFLAGIIIGGGVLALVLYLIQTDTGAPHLSQTDSPPVIPPPSQTTAGPLSPQQSQNPPITPHPDSSSDPHAGISHLRPRKWHHYALGQRNAKALAFNGKYLWIGTSKGLIRYDTTTADQVIVYGTSNGLLSDGIFSLMPDKEGNMWVGTYGGGLSKFDGERWTNYNVPDGLADAFIYDILFLPDGTMWIATWSGANRVQGEISQPGSWSTFTVKNTNGGLPNDWVYALDLDQQGNIWFGTEGGLAVFDGKEWKNWGHKDGLGAPYEVVKEANPPTGDVGKESVHHGRQKIEQGLEHVETAYNPNYIVSMIVDRQGRVWCGTWGAGVSQFDGKRFTTYTTQDGLPGNYIFSLAEGPDGIIWVGTNQGLARFDGIAWKTYTTKDGLFGDAVFSLVLNRKGMWVGSWGGVSHIFEGLQ